MQCPDGEEFPLGFAMDGDAGRSESLDRTLAGIVALMKRSFSVDGATVQMLAPTDVVTVAVWTRRPTALWPGARLHLTRASLRPMLTRRQCVFSGEALSDGFLPILDRILREEGTRCWVCCPLQDEDSIVGALTLGSTVPGSLMPAEESYFHSVASVFERDLVRLGRRAERELTWAGASGEASASGW